MRYAIAGNPNCGKTTIFNALTGMKQKVGNWSGVTVSKKTGRLKHKNTEIEIVDLPGIYSLSATDENSLDEQIACRYILQEKPDAIINVVDASNLERNLYLTMQLIEMNIPIILVVNMVDVAIKKGVLVDYAILAKTLGCTVLPVIGRKKVGIDELKDSLLKKSYPLSFNIDTIYKKEIIDLNNEIKKINTPYPSLWLSTSIIESDDFLKGLLDDKTFNKLTYLKDKLAANLDPITSVPESRYEAVNFITTKVMINKNIKTHKFTEIADKLCMNKYLGMPIFLFVMYLMFQLSINIGGALQPLFDNTSTLIFVDGATHLGLYLGLPLLLISIISQGIGLGINTVVTFAPQIAIMFLFLSILEDSGYMARAAFVMDRFMQSVGLPGKAFVPLIVGFGCNVPAIMGARTLETRRDRLMTIMMAPFVSCGARLAIFSVFAASFFPHGGATIIFLLYVTGILGAVITGYIVKFTFLNGPSSPFIMEIPVYHLPKMKTVLLYSWTRLKAFLFKAGKIIIPICMLIGTLNSIQNNGSIIQNGSDKSLLADIGRIITPVFKPMGIKQDNWPATVGLITGVLAKEVVIGTLNTLYSQQKPQKLDEVKNKPYNFSKNMKQALADTISNFKRIGMAMILNPVGASKPQTDMQKGAMGTMVKSFHSNIAAFAYMIFILLYIPCISVIAAMARESTRAWAIISVAWSTVIAYTSAVIIYQASWIIQKPLVSLMWISIMILVLALTVAIMKFFALNVAFKSNILSGCNSCSSNKNSYKK